jgi:phosphoribosylamine--glycine ligase
MLRRRATVADAFILMDFIDGIEMGIGAYFDGTHFLQPACLDWEHKRFFAGDMGELTGEMGTVATFDRSASFFERTLGRIELFLRGHNHVGYVNLNTIVNDHGIWPLEFTCRFGYPGFAVLTPLQQTPWSELFRMMLGHEPHSFATRPGFSVGILLTTPPFPYTRKQVVEPIGLPILFDGALEEEDRDNFHFGEVGLTRGELVTSGLYGWTMVVTGYGETIGIAREAAYKRARRVHIPNGRYRLDIGEKLAAGDLLRVEQMGYI